jgi:hypothetical protein
MGGKQLGFSDYKLTTAKKQTKREKFLSDGVGRAVAGTDPPPLPGKLMPLHSDLFFNQGA